MVQWLGVETGMWGMTLGGFVGWESGDAGQSYNEVAVIG